MRWTPFGVVPSRADRPAITIAREQRDVARRRLRLLEIELRKTLRDPDATVEDIRTVFSAHCRGEL